MFTYLSNLVLRYFPTIRCLLLVHDSFPLITSVGINKKCCCHLLTCNKFINSLSVQRHLMFSLNSAYYIYCIINGHQSQTIHSYELFYCVLCKSTPTHSLPFSVLLIFSFLRFSLSARQPLSGDPSNLLFGLAFLADLCMIRS